MKYVVTIRVSSYYDFEVDAETQEEAIKIAEGMAEDAATAGKIFDGEEMEPYSVDNRDTNTMSML